MGYAPMPEGETVGGGKAWEKGGGLGKGTSLAEERPMPCGDAQQAPPVAGHNKSPFASLESSSRRVGLRVCGLGTRARACCGPHLH